MAQCSASTLRYGLTVLLAKVYVGGEMSCLAELCGSTVDLHVQPRASFEIRSD